MASPPRLYLITDRHATQGRPLVEVVAAALRGAEPFRGGDGALPVAVALREKDLSARALLALAHELRAVTAAAGAGFYVNGRVDVALACGASGVHLPGEGLSPADVKSIAPALSVAVSTHAAREIELASDNGAAFAVFGPVFDTPSKRGRLEPVGLEGLAQAARVALPVLALGGIDVSNASACLRAGAAGVACIRAVLGANDPAAATAEIFTSFHGEKPHSRGSFLPA